MTSFALITEGITDQVAIESIICGFYNAEPDFREIQPPRDATDESKQGGFAGWEAVLQYCASDEFSDVFSTNDYLIIQIDTDVCGHVNFNVALSDAAGEKSAEQVVDDVREFISTLIGVERFEKFRDRIVFAIAAHSLECWLLPLYSHTKSGRVRIKNCAHHLEIAVKRRGGDYKKDYRCYQAITEPFSKKKNLHIARSDNQSLDIFLENLPKNIDDE